MSPDVTGGGDRLTAGVKSSESPWTAQQAVPVGTGGVDTMSMRRTETSRAGAADYAPKAMPRQGDAAQPVRFAYSTFAERSAV